MNAKFARKTGLFRDGRDVLAMKGVSVGGETQAWMTRGNALPWERYAGSPFHWRRRRRCHAGFILESSGPDFSSLKVFMVIAGGPAAHAGLQDGDDILSINGRPANRYTLTQAREYFEQAKGPQVLRINRGGERLSVTVKCRAPL